MVDLWSPTFEPEFYLRMKTKVMYFHIAVCVTLMLENNDLKIGLRRTFKLI